jgi:uncharacterized RDD family membrane protein YckC
VTSPTAGLGRRFAGFVLDFGLIFQLTGCGAFGRGPTILLGTAYFVACEAAAGRTLGQYCVGVRVVDTDGARPSLPQAVIRGLVRWFEVFGGAGLTLGKHVLVSSPAQTFGDRLSGTFVVDEAHTGPVAPRATRLLAWC